MNVFQRYAARGDKTYYGKFRFQGKQILRNLSTENRAEAEKLIRGIRKEMLAGRFENVEAAKLRPNTATLGEVIDAFRTYAEPRLDKKTVDGYIYCLGWLVNGALGEKSDADIRGRSSAILTEDLVLKFQNNSLKGAGADCRDQDRAKVSANSIYRQARAIFGRRALATYDKLTLPDLARFKTVQLLAEPRASYQPPAAEVIAAAVKACLKLRETDRNAYLAFLLAEGAGLRKKEISHARNSWITREDGRVYIDIGTSEDFRPKGKDARRVPVEAFIAGELEALRIPSLSKSEPDYILTGTMTERCESTFRRLNKTLTDSGLKTLKKTHELRKFYGSLVAGKHGLFAAQKLLGHKDPNVTSRHYAGMTALPEIQIFATPSTTTAPAPVEPVAAAGGE